MTAFHFHFSKSKKVNASPPEADFEASRKAFPLPPAAFSGRSSSPQASLSGEDQAWLSRFEDYVGLHLSSPDLSVPTLADEFAMSESTLLRQVKRLTRQTPVQYLRTVRMKQALELIRQTPSISLPSLAEAVGYQNVRSFSRSFKEWYGRSPAELLNP